MDRVIIVDDESLFLDAMEKRIRGIGGVTLVGKFSNGQQVLDYLETNEDVDVIFADILMPVLDGLKLAQWVAENQPDIRVVLLSAYQSFDYAQQAIRSGVCYYLNKPVRGEMLQEVMDSLRQDRMEALKRELYHHDLERERANQKLFEQARTGEEVWWTWQWMELLISFDGCTGADPTVTHRMQVTGIQNILCHCAPGVAVMLNSQQKKLHCTLVARDTTRLPQLQQVQNLIENLMKFTVHIEVIKNRTVEQELVATTGSKACSREMVRAVEFIRNNLSREISRGEVAAAVGLAPSYFSRVFRQQMGMTFVEFVRNERIQRVIQLLEQGCKVYVAAQQAGFKTMNCFNEIFYQVMGCSPTQYKRRRKEREEQDDGA